MVGAQSDPSESDPGIINEYPHTRFSLSMAIIIVVTIGALFFIGLVSIYIRYCFNRSMHSHSAVAAECIGAWLDSHVTCPVCRTNLVPQAGHVPELTDVESTSHLRNDAFVTQVTGCTESQPRVLNIQTGPLVPRLYYSTKLRRRDDDIQELWMIIHAIIHLSQDILSPLVASTMLLSS
ncbi:unnamed protein product [Fraxinus pennsylvanica]|uniref:RING-type E3 ubiquitin transferase n=1 Tax=Fraxinus pennsylvanica TaxID=56036 RepID=A0AAD1Z7I9_9LAMI|nr:unnamed protein product [Fraxinus pennsylvanica]